MRSTLFSPVTPPYKRSADDSIKCRCAHSGMTGAHSGMAVFKLPEFVLQPFPFFLAPTRSFTRAIFHADMDSRYSFFAPKPHGNACNMKLLVVFLDFSLPRKQPFIIYSLFAAEDVSPQVT